MSTVRWFPLFLAFCGLAGNAWAEAPAPAAAKVAKPKLVLVGLDAAGAPAPEVAAVADSLCSEAGSLGKFEVLCPSELRAILEHQSMGRLLGCEGEDCIKSLAGAVQADLLVQGSVGKIGTVYTLNLKLLDPGTAKVLGRVSRKVEKDLAKLLPQLEPALVELVKSAPTAKPAP